MTRIKEIKARVADATEGPWISELCEGEYLITGETAGHKHFTAISGQSWNADLIANAREDKELEKRDRALAVAKDALEELCLPWPRRVHYRHILNRFVRSLTQ